MSGWEYKVVPAPKKGIKGPRIKGAESRFANALETLMNEMGAQGWEYQRAETLPSVERSGLTSSATEWRNLLVFRRVIVDAIDDFEPELLPAPEATAFEESSQAVVAPVDETQSDADLDTEQTAREARPMTAEPETP